MCGLIILSNDITDNSNNKASTCFRSSLSLKINFALDHLFKDRTLLFQQICSTLFVIAIMEVVYEIQ